MLCTTWYKGTAQLLSLTELKSHLFELYFVGWIIKPMKEGRKLEYPEKTLGDELKKCQKWHILFDAHCDNILCRQKSVSCVQEKSSKEIILHFICTSPFMQMTCVYTVCAEDKGNRDRRVVDVYSCLFVGYLTSQQHASISQGWICTDNFTCCHTVLEVADQTSYLTQSQYADTGPASPSADLTLPGAWQGSHWSANFSVTGMTRPRTNRSASRIRTRDLPLLRWPP